MMVQPRFEDDSGVCQQDTAKFHSLRKFLRRNRNQLLVLALACAALLSYANDSLFIDREDLDNELSLQRILAEEETSLGANNEDEGGGPTFVFIMGIEGTGHHFIHSLLAQSPNMKTMENLGLCKPARGRRASKGKSAVAPKSGELFHLSG